MMRSHLQCRNELDGGNQSKGIVLVAIKFNCFYKVLSVYFDVNENIEHINSICCVDWH